MKTKFFYFLTAFICAAVPIAAQTGNYETRISWNGVSFMEDGVTRTGINWLFGVDEQVNGAQANFLFGFVDTSTTGLQSSLLFNSTGENLTGCQSSFFYNGSGSAAGLMFAPMGLNISESSVRGVQAAFLGNIAADSCSYGQIGLANYTGTDAGFGQLGAVSINAGFTGVQLNTLASISRGTAKGVQASPISLAFTLTGAQLGLINIAESITGTQIGLINRAKTMKGVQVGIVNICDELDGIPIGIIDIQKNGENHAYYLAETPVYGSFERLYHTIGYRFGSKYFYKSLSFGFSTGDVSGDLPSYSAGFHGGLRVPLFKNSVSIMGAAGISAANWQQVIEIDEQDSIRHHLIPETMFMGEWKFYKNIGVLFGTRQRYYCDVWNSRNMPDRMTELVRSPYGSLFVQNSLFLGVQY